MIDAPTQIIGLPSQQILPFPPINFREHESYDDNATGWVLGHNDSEDANGHAIIIS